jgi:RNA polymerase sigma-70 factor, ECF subfamily
MADSQFGIGNGATELGWRTGTKRIHDSPAKIYEVNCWRTARQRDAECARNYRYRIGCFSSFGSITIFSGFGILQKDTTDQNLRCVKTMDDTSLFGYINGLFGYAMVLARNPTEAADLVQETYVRALKAKENLRHSSNVKSWMFTILRNIWLNQLRHKRCAPQIVELEAREGTADTAIKTSEDPHAQYISRMEQGEVRHAIQRLPAQFREIIILREYEELSYREIAAMLECPAGTVMSRLARARSRLRVLLSGHEQSFQRNESRKFKACSPEL